MPSVFEDFLITCSPEEPQSLNITSDFLLENPHPLYITQPLSLSEKRLYTDQSLNYVPIKIPKIKKDYKWNVELDDREGDFDADGNFILKKPEYKDKNINDTFKDEIKEMLKISKQHENIIESSDANTNGLESIRDGDINKSISPDAMIENTGDENQVLNDICDAKNGNMTFE
jgi:hypothetical protein